MFQLTGPIVILSPIFIFVNVIIFLSRRLSELGTVDLNKKLAGRVAKEGT